MDFDRIVNIDGMIGDVLRSDIDLRFFPVLSHEQRDRMWEIVGLNADSTGGRITRRIRNYCYKELGFKLDDGIVTRLGNYIASKVPHRGEYRVVLSMNCDLVYHASRAANKEDLLNGSDPLGIDTCYGYGGSYHWVVDSMCKNENAYVMLIYQNDALISRTWCIHFPEIASFTLFNTYGAISRHGAFEIFNQAMGGEYLLFDSNEDARSITENRIFVNSESTMRVIHKDNWLSADADSMLKIHLEWYPLHCSMCGYEPPSRDGIRAVRMLGNFCSECLGEQEVLFCEMCGDANLPSACIEVTYVRDSSDTRYEGVMCSNCEDECSYCESCGGYHI